MTTQPGKSYSSYSVARWCCLLLLLFCGLAVSAQTVSPQQLAELQKQVMEIADGQPADQEVLLAGYRFTVPVGMKRIKRTIVNLPALFKRLGQPWVVKHCAPSLSDLDKALEPVERAKYLEESRELSRIVGEPVESPALSRAA